MSIYKYLSPQRTHVVETGTLRATQAGALNDPFELKPVFDSVIEKAELEAEAKRDALFDKAFREQYMKLPARQRATLPFYRFRDFLKRDRKQQFDELMQQQVDAIASHLPNLTERFRQLLYDTFSTKVGIVSFSRTASEELMWAHYAGDHKGFVLEFDETHSFFDRRRSASDEFFHLRPAIYEAVPTDNVKLKDLDGERVLCSKHAKWSYEQESRILIPVDPGVHVGGGEPIHLIEFPRDCLSAVILGDRASAELEATLRSTVAESPLYSHIKWKRARADIRSGQILISDFQ